MAFVERDECISIFSLSISFLFLFFFCKNRLAKGKNSHFAQHGKRSYFAQDNSGIVLNTALPTESMTMAFVERDECISIFSLSISFLFLFCISCPEKLSFGFLLLNYLMLSHLCYAYMCSYMGRKFVIKILVSCISCIDSHFAQNTHTRHRFIMHLLQSSTDNGVMIISIFHGCMVWIEKSVTRVTDRHHEACLVMPNSDPE